MQIFQIRCFSLIRGYKETYKHNYLIYQNTECIVCMYIRYVTV